MSRELKAWWRQCDRIMLFIFVAGSGILSGANELRIQGALLVFSLTGLYFSGQRRSFPVNSPPPELIFFSLWVVWSGITGLFIIHDQELFWKSYRVVFQNAIMIWTIYGLLRYKMTPYLVFCAILTYALVEAIVALLSAYSISDLTNIAQRITGLSANPNALGFFMVQGTIAAMLLWHSRFLANWFRKMLLLGFILAFGYVTSLSGSRDAWLSYSVMTSIWVVFLMPRGRGVQKLAVRILALLILAAAFFLTVPFVMNKTAIGTRWQELEKTGSGDVKEGLRKNVRYELYKSGLRMFSEKPIMGFGLGQFQATHWSGLYSHSDPIEVLSTTGAVGFFLYEGVFVILIVRLWRLQRLAMDPLEQYRLKMMMMGNAIILFVGLGTVHTTSQFAFIYIATLSAYTWTRVHEVRSGASAWQRHSALTLNHFRLPPAQVLPHL